MTTIHQSGEKRSFYYCIRCKKTEQSKMQYLSDSKYIPHLCGNCAIEVGKEIKALNEEDSKGEKKENRADQLHYGLDRKKCITVCGKNEGNWTTKLITFWSWRPRCKECEEIVSVKNLQPSENSK